MNLIRLALAAEKLVQGQPAIMVDAGRCQRAADKTSACDLCTEACPTSAITLNGNPSLDLARCIRCGLCLNACPAGVFDGADGTYRLLNCVTKLVDRSTLEIACKHHPDPARGARDVDAVVQTDGCLSALGASAYVGLLALGVEQVRVRLDACPDCPLRLLQPAIERTLRRANALVIAGQSASRVVPALERRSGRPANRPVFSVKNPPLSRRNFLRLAALQTESVVDQLAPRHEPQVDGQRSAPRERRRLVRALGQLPWLRQDAVLADEEFTLLSASEACDACGVCARVCPTGAIDMQKTEAGFALRFVAADCTNCGLCLDTCGQGALGRSGAPQLSQVISGQAVLLRSGALQRCAKCHTTFSGEIHDGLCPLCASRRQQPFGGHVPEAVLKRLPEDVRARLQTASTSQT